MEEKFAVSVIVSIYNKIDYLKMILAALERQSFKNFEVIITDDGSKETVVTEIKEIQKSSPLAIQHLWQEDQGFRKVIILNEAIRQSKSDYLIFIDGDCVPHAKFIEEHYKNKHEKIVLAGRRVNLSDKISKQLTEEKIRNGFLERGFTRKILVDSVFGKSNHVIKGIYVKNRQLRKFLNRSVKGVLGCNFSIHKKDLIDINGFDERYLAPAVGEDTDIEYRLLWNNVSIKMIKNMAIQYHFYHKLLPRSRQNESIFEDVKRERKHFTPYGLVKN